MKPLSFWQRNQLKMELYSTSSEHRKQEIIELLEKDEEISMLLDMKGELGDEGY
jgi:hypothetical protein